MYDYSILKTVFDQVFQKKNRDKIIRASRIFPKLEEWPLSSKAYKINRIEDKAEISSYRVLFHMLDSVVSEESINWCLKTPIDIHFFERDETFEMNFLEKTEKQGELKPFSFQYTFIAKNQHRAFVSKKEKINV